VAEGARLESVYTGNRIVGSNPTPSANSHFPKLATSGHGGTNSEENLWFRPYSEQS
jgi:hypothetical protein